MHGKITSLHCTENTFSINNHNVIIVQCVKKMKEKNCERIFPNLLRTSAPETHFSSCSILFSISYISLLHILVEKKCELRSECHFVTIYEQTSFPSNQFSKMSIWAVAEQRLNGGVSTFPFYYLIFWISLFFSFIKNELKAGWGRVGQDRSLLHLKVKVIISHIQPTSPKC